MQSVMNRGMSGLYASGCEILPFFFWEEGLLGSTWPPILLLWCNQKRELVKPLCPEIRSETPMALCTCLQSTISFTLSLDSRPFISFFFYWIHLWCVWFKMCSCSCAEKFYTILGQHAIAQNSSLPHSSSYFMKLFPCWEEHKEPLEHWRLHLYFIFTELSFIEHNTPTGIDWEGNEPGLTSSLSFLYTPRICRGS